MKAGTPWGATLWEAMQDRLDAVPPERMPEDADADLLLGGLGGLANRCRVWFSTRFNVDAEIARRRAQQGEAP